MLTLIAAKKTASVIVFMMIDLLALFVSRPALFFVVCGQANDIALVQTCNWKCIRQHIANFRNLDRALSITNADHRTACCSQANRPSVQLRRGASVRHSRRAVRRRSVTGRQARGAQERIAVQFVKSATTPLRRGDYGACRKTKQISAMATPAIGKYRPKPCGKSTNPGSSRMTSPR